MKKEKGSITLYVSIVCLFILIVGIVAYVGASNKQAMQIAQLKQIEEEYNNKDVTAEDLYKEYEGGDIVPVYTPEQFAKVGTGEEVYVAEDGKIYTYSADKTYMFYGIAEDLTETIKNDLKEQLKDEIKIEIQEEGITVSTVKRQKPIAPQLASNMVAVYWSKDGGATASVNEEGASPIYSKIDADGKPSSSGTENSNFIEANWYEYIEGYNQVDIKTSRWANGVTDDGSYWVWIPRFKYKVVEKPGVNGTYSAGTVDVKFISLGETSGVSLNGSRYTTRKNAEGDFITQDEEGYTIHPAFENGSSNGAKAQGQTDYVEYNNGEWDSELSGFWIAKYEMSAENASGTATQPGNVAISDTVKLVSKPGVSSWRSITTGNSYKNCYNYNRENESHMIKMSEWGAVAFLTHSQYGRNGNEVSMNASNYTTAYTGELGSTTGNIYGVYDMNGGAWERVAAWDTLSTSGNLTSYGNVTIDGYTYGVSGGVSTKYATAYRNGTGTYNGVLAKTVCKTGDAVRETYTASDRAWFNDYSDFARSTDPFFLRGGTYGNGEGAGAFASSITTGEAYASVSFRAVLLSSV